ncbi:hypothetical protein B0A55_04866 [Friedmanniomyces simplex]|uniref:F-box domain-containing protein n=1 Tax=Friedmanniomyces simplex TaxID=329884 RepID=A0A4V6WL58_9PEZI|nr:hypothetical protein B0A55_04866 [Friedmanniomyces simplex]
MFPSTTTAPGGADVKPKSLLALPPELRLEIYSHVFALLVPDVEDYEVAKIDAFPGFMRTCTLMRAEALPEYRGYLKTTQRDLSRHALMLSGACPLLLRFDKGGAVSHYMIMEGQAGRTKATRIEFVLRTA